MRARRSLPTTVLVPLLLVAVGATLSLLLWEQRAGDGGGGSGRGSDTGVAVPAASRQPAGETAGKADREAGGKAQASRLVRAVALLRSWDARRADAWARGDERALRRLYAAGSSSGEADLAMLRSYAERDLVVAGLRTQVLSASLRRWQPGRVTLLVIDRVAGGVAVGAATAVLLPRDQATPHTVELVRRQGRWLVKEAR